MKIILFLKPLVIISLILVLASCADSNGNSGDATPIPTDPNQTFTLSKLKSTTPGTVYSTRLTGQTSDGVTISGSMSMANRAKKMLNGVLVIPQEAIISITIGEFMITETATSNIDVNGNLISIVMQTAGVICTPVSPDAMPTAVKIGDFGILSTLTCNDKTIQQRNWSVEGAGNGKIRVVLNATVKNQNNSIASVSKVMYTLDGAGNIIAFKVVSMQPQTNFSLTYESV